MTRKNKVDLADRVSRAAETLLADRKQVSFVDVLVVIGWLAGSHVSSWRQGRLDCLEEAMQVDPSRISQAMTLFESWTKGKGLSPSVADYVARSPERQPLRFSRRGDPALEERYRTHWISPDLPESVQGRLAKKASRPPELVVVMPLNKEWKCHRCGQRGDLLIMEKPGPACLRCVGLDDLEYLASGDALLTRRAKAKSVRAAVVVRFSRSRRRYERQGLLVEPQALAAAQREISAQRSR
jgi:hypothetical protein